ncbi:cupin domain-containing protein [Nanoarchaeota archaeon]
MVCICEDLEFYSNPKRSKSDKSEAIYLARNREKGLLLQYLPPHSHTSIHYHKIRTEIYHIIEGTCILNIDGNDILLSQGKYEVKPNMVHQVKTNQNPALTLIKIIGDPKGISLDDHFYL